MTGSSSGEHALTASAIPVAGEVDLADNSKSTTSTMTGGGEPVIIEIRVLASSASPRRGLNSLETISRLPPEGKKLACVRCVRGG